MEEAEVRPAQIKARIQCLTLKLKNPMPHEQIEVILRQIIELQKLEK